MSTAIESVTWVGEYLSVTCIDGSKVYGHPELLLWIPGFVVPAREGNNGA